MTDTKFVYDELLKLGIDVYGYHIRIHDVGLSTIMLHGGKNITRKTAGLAVHCGHRHDIYLLSSLSNTKRKGVLAHELGNNANTTSPLHLGAGLLFMIHGMPSTGLLSRHLRK